MYSIHTYTRSLRFYQHVHVTCIYLPNFIKVSAVMTSYRFFKMAAMASQFLFRLRV